MKPTIKLALALALAAIALGLTAVQALADDGDDAPAPAMFKPWQRIWQCNDIRVTETMQRVGFIHYDLAGTIIGGSQFALDMRGPGQLYFNGRPCFQLR